MLMIHNPWTMAIGNASELRKQADDLDKITESSIQTYLDTAGDKLDEATLRQLMDDETWLTAKEAVGYGLATEVIEPNKAAASISKNFAQRYRHVPEQLIQTSVQKQQAKVQEDDEVFRKQLLERYQNNLKAINNELQTMKEEQTHEFLPN